MNFSRQAPRASYSPGFSYVEVLLTVALMSILALATAPLLQISAQRQKEQELRRALREVRAAIDLYKQYTDVGVIQKSQEDTGYPKTLDVLVEGVNDQRSPEPRTIYLLRRLPRDPLQTDPALPAAQTWGVRSYQSSPENPQEGDDIYDIYSLSKRKGLNGIPYKEW